MIADYDFSLEHRLGKYSQNVDAISRIRPCERGLNGQPCKQCHKSVTGMHVNAVQTRRKMRLRQTDRSADKEYDVRDSHCNDTQPIVPSDSSMNFQKGPSPILCDPAIDSELESLDDVCDNDVEVSEPSPPSQPRKQNSRRQGGATGLIARTAPTAAAKLSEWDYIQVRDKQLNDPDIGPAVYWVETNARPQWRDVKSCSPALRALWQQYDTLVTLDGVLHRVFYNSDGDVQCYQLVLPCTLKYSFLELIHGDLCAHLGEAKCKLNRIFKTVAGGTDGRKILNCLFSAAINVPHISVVNNPRKASFIQ